MDTSFHAVSPSPPREDRLVGQEFSRVLGGGEPPRRRRLLLGRGPPLLREGLRSSDSGWAPQERGVSRLGRSIHPARVAFGGLLVLLEEEEAAGPRVLAREREARFST